MKESVIKIKPKPVKRGNTAKNLDNELESYAITLDIKENVIAELRNNIENLTNSNKSQAIISIPALNDVFVQLYWAYSDMAFEEKNSLTLHTLIEDTPGTLYFSLPISENIDFLRFDIGNAVGFLNIHSIEIKNASGELTWIWDKRSINYKSGALFIENSSYFEGKIVQLSTNYDPQFILQINSTLDTRNFIGCTIEIMLSKVSQTQADILNTFTSLLSFHPEKEFSDLSETISFLMNEKTSLSAALSASTESVTKLEGEKQLLDKSIHANELLIQQLVSDKAVLEKDKSFFIDDLEQKKVLINKFLTDASNSQNELKEKTEHLNALLVTLDKEKQEKLQLHNDLTSAHSSSTLLGEKIEYLEKTLNTEKTHYLNNTESLNATIKQLNDNKELLVSEIGVKNGLIDQLAAKSEEFESANNSLIKLNAEIGTYLTTEKEKNASLISQNEALQNKYTALVVTTNELLDQNKTSLSAINELSLQNKDIIHALKEQENKNNALQGLINDRQKDINEFARQNKDLSVLLNSHKEAEARLSLLNKEKDQENKLLNESIMLLKWEINNYVENYKKKSIFQIAKNRILKKY